MMGMYLHAPERLCKRPKMHVFYNTAVYKKVVCSCSKVKEFSVLDFYRLKKLISVCALRFRITVKAQLRPKWLIFFGVLEENKIKRGGFIRTGAIGNAK